MKIKKGFLWILCALLVLMNICISASAQESGTELAVLSTTDMHGKCWEKNILTGTDVEQNMLRVSTAVKEMRQLYGDENVILIDNGDLFQGTPISEEYLRRSDIDDKESEVMAMCLKEIGYDVFVLGNHEFDFPWEHMSRVYEDLQKNDVAVLAANVYYDGSDGVHDAGENVFGTFVIREVTVNGHQHKIGILGLENTDVERGNSDGNYPGMIFSHPDNPDYDLGKEADHYISRMLDEGCEMIILSYHGGLGNTEMPLSFGVNTNDQGKHILESTDRLDLLVNGHDHSTEYSNSFVTDRAGRAVPVINGGGQGLAMAVFRLTEDQDGKLICEYESGRNLMLSDFEPDRELEEKVRPYADAVSAIMEEQIGNLSGKWDDLAGAYTEQSDTLDLISAAMMYVGTKRMTAKYKESGLKALEASTGLDHLDIDAVCSSVANAGFAVSEGCVTFLDTYGMYRFSNSILVIPMYGSELKAVMEENVRERLSASVINDEVCYFIDDPNSYLTFGGINFSYDLSRPEGEQVVIRGFSNGRPFEPDAVYLVAVNNYVLGNDGCGLRIFSKDDALWAQKEDDAGSNIRDIIREYITGLCENGGTITPDMFDWEWDISTSADPSEQ